VLFTVAAITDYYDGMLARTRGLVTNLGKLLDPLADKLLLVATLLPMYWLQRPIGDGGLDESLASHAGFPFFTPVGEVRLPAWILVVVLGRELFMTLFRQLAARRGVVIAAIGPAKWKTAFQCVWVGSAFFWFFALTLAADRGWTSAAWRAFALVNGVVGVVTMTAAVVLTVYSLVLYLRRYGGILLGRAPRSA
jgi:CDP-diacylglycerol--glycerol-3-phosphate 3-phosphatidyltransferase